MKPNFFYLLLVFLLLLFSCKSKKQQTDPLPSWNETPIKKSLITYITQTAQIIPIDDRIAVFDLDGTLACEKPLWFEMYMAVKGLNEQSARNSDLLKLKEYQFADKLADNPSDTSVLNYWDRDTINNYIDSMIWKAYAGTDHETYIDSAGSFFSRTLNTKFKIALADMFYQPMLELIQLLKDNQFTIYVASGSVRGVIWSVCPQTLKLSRTNLIGTSQIMLPVYQPEQHKTLFIIKKGIIQPKNNGNGKSRNIYAQIGKIPVFAFGNTTSDFGMFHLSSTSKYPNAAYMLNHDNDSIEYKYNPYYGPKPVAWEDSLLKNNWKRVDLSKEFKMVWENKRSKPVL